MRSSAAFLVVQSSKRGVTNSLALSSSSPTTSLASKAILRRCYSTKQQYRTKASVSTPAIRTRVTTRNSASNGNNNTGATAASIGNDAAAIDPPTRLQLWRVFCTASVPMIGFGFTDQTIMLQAGNAIDCTLGVTFGLSTLTAAAFGQICSDASGVLFGGTLESIANKAGLPSANLTTAQRSLPIVKRMRLFGGFCGIILGCSLGLINLFFIDTDRSSSLKVQATYSNTAKNGSMFQIEASNEMRPNMTALVVRGPNVDGLLASMTAALAEKDCSLVELHARNINDDDKSENDQHYAIKDTFYIVKRSTGEPYENEELQDLVEYLLEATKTPNRNVHTILHELERTNAYLQARITTLEEEKSQLQQQQHHHQ